MVNVDFGLKLASGTSISRLLITMPLVKAENELVWNFIEIGDILLELRIGYRQRISQFNFDKFVEFLGSLLSV